MARALARSLNNIGYLRSHRSVHLVPCVSDKGINMSISNVVNDSQASRDRGNKYNQFPPNMIEVSPSEFWHNVSVPRKIETRQPFLYSEDAPYGYFWGTLIMYYTDEESGYAFTTHWDPTPNYQGPNDVWPRFFWFGPCRHAWRELTQKEAHEKGIIHHGMCYHVEECVKCEKIWTYDSSG